MLLFSNPFRYLHIYIYPDTFCMEPSHMIPSNGGGGGGEGGRGGVLAGSTVSLNLSN